MDAFQPCIRIRPLLTVVVWRPLLAPDQMKSRLSSAGNGRRCFRTFLIQVSLNSSVLLNGLLIVLIWIGHLLVRGIWLLNLIGCQLGLLLQGWPVFESALNAQPNDWM